MKGQSSIEFLILFSLLVFFSIAILYINLIRSIKNEELNKYFDAQRIANFISNEVMVAEIAGDGYTRSFVIPATMYNFNMFFYIDGSLEIEWNGGSYLRKMPSRNITDGYSDTFQLLPGVNKITNNKGSIIFGDKDWFNVLVGYWKFDENSGNTVYDSSNYKNDGTLYGGLDLTGWVGVCKSGPCLNFTGDNDYVRIPNSEAFDFADEDFTVGFWMKGGDQNYIGYFFSKNYAANNLNGVRWYGCGMVGTSDTPKLGHIRCWIRDGTNPDVEPNTIGHYNDSQWHHVALKRDTTANKFQIFVDGVLDGSATDTAGSLSNMTVSPNNNLFIGTRADRGTGWNARWFNGTIDEFKIWNRALSDDEIWAEYEMGG